MAEEEHSSRSHLSPHEVNSRLAAYSATMNSDHHSMDGMYQRMAHTVPEMAAGQAAEAPPPPPPHMSAQPAAGVNNLQNHVQDPARPDASGGGGTEVRQTPPEVKTEPGGGGGMDPPPSDATMQAIMTFLRKNNLLDTESKLRDELKKREVTSSAGSSISGGAVGSGLSRPIAAAPATADHEVGNVLASYKSEGDPTSYESAYKWV